MQSVTPLASLRGQSDSVEKQGRAVHIKTETGGAQRLLKPHAEQATMTHREIAVLLQSVQVGCAECKLLQVTRLDQRLLQEHLMLSSEHNGKLVCQQC